MKSSPSMQDERGRGTGRVAFYIHWYWCQLAVLRLHATIFAFHARKVSSQTPNHDHSSTLYPQSKKKKQRLLAGNGVCTSAISLLSNGKLDTLTLGQRDPWLLGTDDENVAFTGSERVVYGILDVDNVETSIVTLSVSDDTNTTHVATTSDHGNDTGIELDVILDLAGCEVDLDGVVDLDGWVRVTDTVHKISSAFLGELYSNR